MMQLGNLGQCIERVPGWEFPIEELSPARSAIVNWVKFT